MNLWLYLLSTICAHSCNFPTPQVMLMMMIGMRTIAMSIRFGVNQSTVSLCGASVESVVYFILSLLYKTMWVIMFRYVINTAMVHLRFVYLCVRLILGTYESFMHPILFLKYGCDKAQILLFVLRDSLIVVVIFVCQSISNSFAYCFCILDFYQNSQKHLSNSFAYWFCIFGNLAYSREGLAFMQVCLWLGKHRSIASLYIAMAHTGVIPDFKDKIRYAPYVSLRSQISHIATNKG